MECCANQEAVLKKPFVEFTAQFAPTGSLDPPLKAQLEDLEGHFITHEGLSGPIVFPAFLSSSPILRI